MIRQTKVNDYYRLRFNESPLAHQYCQGTGIEIGASAHNAFGLPGALNVAINNPDEFEYYKTQQVEMCGHFAEADLWREDGQPLPVEDTSQDYVISSHVLEHIPNAIGELMEWDRVLKVGGVVFIIVPTRVALSSDIGRELTTMEEFNQLYERSATRVDTPGVEGGHYHVFSLESLVELIETGTARGLWQWEIVERHETDDKVGNGHLVVARKVAARTSAPEPEPAAEPERVNEAAPKNKPALKSPRK